MIRIWHIPLKPLKTEEQYPRLTSDSITMTTSNNTISSSLMKFTDACGFHSDTGILKHVVLPGLAGDNHLI